MRLLFRQSPSVSRTATIVAGSSGRAAGLTVVDPRALYAALVVGSLYVGMYRSVGVPAQPRC